MTGPATHTEVFYLNPRDGWAAAPFDAGGHQIGAALTAFRQREALAWIRADHPGLPPHVFTRDGTLRRIPPPRGDQPRANSTETNQ